ncbi:MAG: glycosyltransferase family 4 protein [Gemmatales bacterium]|nr:glycosyltransferase family 4 protein [Gemmatales bacterium]MDW8221854.1 glycosyltransferase family 4 protein [Gemmatales bacterium]
MISVLDVRVLRGNGGGPEKTLGLSARYLRDLGYQMTCAYLCDPEDEAAKQTIQNLRQQGTEVYVLDDCGPMDWKPLRGLTRIISNLGVVIYHGHDYKSNVLAGLLARGCLRVATLHGWVSYTTRLKYYYAIEKICLRQFARIYCVSRELCQWAQRYRIPPQRLYYLPNGIVIRDYERKSASMEARQKRGLPSEGFWLGAVGRLSEEKNLVSFIEVVHLLRRQGWPIWGLLVGDGPLRKHLERMVLDLKVSNYVVFAGHQKDVRPWLECMDAYLCCSLREGMPNSVLEAMAMEVPVLAMPVGELPYMICHGTEGILFSTGRVEEIAEIVKAMIRGIIDYQRLGKEGRRRVEKDFSFEQRMKRLAGDYDRLLAEYRKRLVKFMSSN